MAGFISMIKFMFGTPSSVIQFLFLLTSPGPMELYILGKIISRPLSESTYFILKYCFPNTFPHTLLSLAFLQLTNFFLHTDRQTDLLLKTLMLEFKNISHY